MEKLRNNDKNITTTRLSIISLLCCLMPPILFGLGILLGHLHIEILSELAFIYFVAGLFGGVVSYPIAIIIGIKSLFMRKECKGILGLIISIISILLSIIQLSLFIIGSAQGVIYLF